MKSQIAWLTLGACACGVLGAVVLEYAAGAAPANSPIVLSYRESPILLGPHEHWVTSLAFSPDGKTVATGASDGYLRLWDSATGRLKLMAGDDSTRGVAALAFSPDGQMVATAGGLGCDGQLWETATGREVRAFEEQGVPRDAPFIYKGKPITARAMHAVAFSPDGRLLAIAGDSVTVRDVQSAEVVATLRHPFKGVNAIVFSPDGKALATAGVDRKVRLWSMPEGVLEATLDGPTQPLNCVAISPDGTTIVATSSRFNRSGPHRDKAQSGQFWAWDRGTKRGRKIEIGNMHVGPVAFVTPKSVAVGAGLQVVSIDLASGSSPSPRTVWTHSDDVIALAVSPDGRLRASGGHDRTVDIVDIASGKLVHRLPGLTDSITSVATFSDSKRFATASGDIRFTNRFPSYEGSFEAQYKAHFSGDTNATRMQPSEVCIWSADDGQQQSTLPLPPSQVTAITAIPKSDLLAIAGWIPEKGGLLSIWDVTSGKQVREFGGLVREVLDVAVSPDGRTLASGDAEGNFILWDIQSGSKLQSHKHAGSIEAVAFSPNGQYVASGAGDRTVRIYDVRGEKLDRTLTARADIEALAFSPEASLLVAGLRDPGIELWDLKQGTPGRTLKAEGDGFGVMPGFAAFSADGRFVACGGKGKDIAIFDVAKGTLHGELRGHFHAPTVAAFLPDGRLVSGAEERTIRLWDPDRLKLLATWVVVPGDANQNWREEWVGYSPSGEFVGSRSLERLIGWQTDGVVVGPNDAQRRHRVDSLFANSGAAGRQ